MRARTLLAAGLSLYVVAVVSAPIDAQRAGAFRGSTEDPAIKYSTAPLNNAVADVNRKLEDGTLAAHVRRPQRIPAVGARGAADSRRLAAAGLLARQPAGTTDRRPESARDVLQRTRHTRLGARRRHHRGRRARRVGWRRVLHARPARGRSRTRRSSRAPFICLGCHMAGDTLACTRPPDVQHDAPGSIAGFSLPRFVDHRPTRSDDGSVAGS